MKIWYIPKREDFLSDYLLELKIAINSVLNYSESTMYAFRRLSSPLYVLKAKHRISLFFRIAHFQVEAFHGFVYLLWLFSDIYFIPEGHTL